MKQKVIAMTGVLLILLLLLAGPVAAQGPEFEVEGTAIMKAPAVDAATVSGMEGFPLVTEESLLQTVRMGPEGVVIRQSMIEDGQIVVPPGGIYYTIRQGGLRFPLANYPILLLGEVYYLADWDVVPQVKQDFVIANKEAVPFGILGDHALEASTGSSWGSDSENASVNFKILKISGNYYGTVFGPLYTADEFARPMEAVLDGTTGEPAGTAVQVDRLAASGVSYAVVDEVTTEEAHVVEWGFYEMPVVYLAKEASQAALAADETMPLGDGNEYQARVVAIDAENMSVDVAIETVDGEVVAEQTLGPLTAEVASTLPSDNDNLKSLLLRYEDVQVGLDAFREPFAEEGVVSLVGYSDILEFTHGAEWEADPNYIAMVDT